MSAITGTKKIWFVLLAVTAILGLYLRCSGTFRGLDVPYFYHPDEMKQVTALHNYLQGHYVWYTGSLFYDGYPYGLNHVDEWLLRPVLPLRNLVLRTLYGTSTNPTIPAMPEMYYWARGLRILYGMVILWLVFITARKLFDKPGPCWLAVMLTAIAPLSVCVSHFATGDIGVDLFGTLTILMLCLYADTDKLRYIFLGGMTTGLAFGCKYNGMLLGIIIAVYALMQLFSEKRFKTFLLQGITAASGCITGILISTPAFLINFRQTRKDMIDNFTFIKNYEVDPDFVAKPFHIKAWFGLTQNTPMILQAFGWTVVTLAAMGLIIAIWKYCDKSTSEPSRDMKNRAAAALYSLPFLALLISLTGKPNIQPFHFSYIQIPLILGAVSTITWLWQNKPKWSHILSVICSIAVIVELGAGMTAENFFWQREDNILFAREMPGSFSQNASNTSNQVIKNIYLESGGVSAFRNRENAVKCQLNKTWNSLQSLPVPAIPYPADHEWIFLNGPTFPRNDRMFTINNNEIRNKHLVLHSRPREIKVGLRSSAWPVQTTVNIGNDMQELFLEPNEQRILTFTPRKWRHCPDNDSDRESFIVPIDIETKTGNLVATVLASESEKNAFMVFGGTATNYTDILPQDKDTETLRECLQQSRYIETNHCNIRFIATKHHSTKKDLPQTGMFLSCGAYELECDICGLAPTSIVTFALTDGFGSLKQPATELTITPGVQQITYRFSKNFAPYYCQVQIQCKSGKLDLESWRIRPDIKAITDSLKTWRETNIAPEWMQRYPTKAAWEGCKSELHNVIFDKAISLKNLEYSPSVKNGKSFSVRPMISTTCSSYSAYDVTTLFFHILDQNGKQVAAFDISLRDAVANAYAGTATTLTETFNIPAGNYELWTGIWNTRTHKRLSISGGTYPRKDSRRHRILAGTLTVTQP